MRWGVVLLGLGVAAGIGSAAYFAMRDDTNDCEWRVELIDIWAQQNGLSVLIVKGNGQFDKVVGKMADPLNEPVNWLIWQEGRNTFKLFADDDWDTDRFPWDDAPEDVQARASYCEWQRSLVRDAQTVDRSHDAASIPFIPPVTWLKPPGQ